MFRYTRGVGLLQRFRSFPATVRMRNAEHDRADAACFIRHLARSGRRDLYGVEVTAIADAVDVLGQLLVDSHQHKGFFKLRCPVRR